MKSRSLIPSLNPSKGDVHCVQIDVFLKQFSINVRFKHLHFQAWLHPTHLQPFSEKCSPSVLMPECVSGQICDTLSGKML